MMDKYKIPGRTLVSIAILLLLAIIIPIYISHYHGTKKAAAQTVTELVFADTKQGKIYITDNTGHQLSAASYSSRDPVTGQALASNGGFLGSIDAGLPSEQFVFTRDNAIETLAGKTASALKSSVLVQLSHQLFFTDSKSVLLVSCPPGSDCVLNTLDLSNGSSKKLLDIGVKQADQYLPVSYLVGYQPSQHTAFLWVFGKNKLGNQMNAVYEVDVNSHKVLKTIDTSDVSGSNIAVSPDGQKLAYTAANSKGAQMLNIVSLQTGKTQKIKWTDGTLPSAPNSLVWSPDSTKLLLQTIYINVQSGKPAPTELAYLDISNNNSVSALLKINDPTLETVSDLGWANNDTVVYELKKAQAPNQFTGGQILSQKLGTSSSSAMKVPAGDLVMVASY